MFPAPPRPWETMGEAERSAIFGYGGGWVGVIDFEDFAWGVLMSWARAGGVLSGGLLGFRARAAMGNWVPSISCYRGECGGGCAGGESD